MRSNRKITVDVCCLSGLQAEAQLCAGEWCKTKIEVQ